MLQIIDQVVDRVYKMPTPLKWLSSFGLIFLLTFSSSILMATPFVLMGASFPFMFGNSIGIGVGIGLFYSVYYTFGS
jgi:hypothetical protein